LLGYLRSSLIETGLLINFGAPDPIVKEVHNDGPPSCERIRRWPLEGTKIHENLNTSA
jgi:hypothetical protein